MFINNETNLQTPIYGKNEKSAKSPKTRDPSIHPELVSGYGRSGAWEGLICKVKAPENSPGGSHLLHKVKAHDVQSHEDMFINHEINLQNSINGKNEKSTYSP